MRSIGILTAVLAVPALAHVALAAPPANKQACLDKAFSLAESGAKKKLAADAGQKLETMLSGLEAKCTAGDLAAAEGDIKAIDEMLKATK